MIKIKNTPFLYPLLSTLILLLLLIKSWNAPLLNSHYYRQTQTAQTIQFFLTEGWNPFYPKVWFVGQPGYLALEFPLYQSIVFFFSKYLHFTIEQAGRILNITFALLFAIAISKIFELFLSRPREKTNGFSHTQRVLMILCSPLVFGVSQWVSIELLNCALGAWSLYLLFLIFTEKESPGTRSLILYCLFGVLLTGSLLIKPNVLLALSPYYFYILLRFGKKHPKPLTIVSSLCFLAVLITAMWFNHAEHLNHQQAHFNPHGTAANKITLLQFINDHSWVNSHNILKLLGRILIYVVGPTALFYIFIIFINRKNRLALNNPLIIVSMISILIYLTAFSSLNIIHNYYQLPLVLPCFIAFFYVLDKNKLQLTRKWKLIFRLSIVLLAVSQLIVAHFQLNRQDQDLANTIVVLQGQIKNISAQDSFHLVSNLDGAPALLGYYLKKYYNEASPLLIAVCDTDIDANCVEQTIRLQPDCDQSYQKFNRIWTCLHNES